MVCGTGADKAKVDLRDGPAGFPDCETAAVGAVDQHPTVKIKSSVLRLKEGAGGPFVKVLLKCPQAIHRGCRGELSIRRLGAVAKRSRATRAGAVIGHHRYAKIAAGSSRRVKVPIDGGAALAAEHGHIEVRIQAAERDRKGRRKVSLRTVRLTG